MPENFELKSDKLYKTNLGILFIYNNKFYIKLNLLLLLKNFKFWNKIETLNKNHILIKNLEFIEVYWKGVVIFFNEVMDVGDENKLKNLYWALQIINLNQKKKFFR